MYTYQREHTEHLRLGAGQGQTGAGQGQAQSLLYNDDAPLRGLPRPSLYSRDWACPCPAPLYTSLHSATSMGIQE